MDFILDSNLVLYLPLYRLDGASFASKDAYGHLCTATGATWNLQGHLFDANNENIDCGSSDVLAPTDEISLEAWIFNISLAGTDVIAWRGSNTWADGYGMWYSSPNLRFMVDNYINNQAFVAFAFENSWHHVVGTYDKNAGKVRIFLNGEEGTSDIYSTSITHPATTLKIGHHPGGGAGAFWNGYIGEVRLYNRALTPQEILHNYLSTKWRYN